MKKEFVNIQGKIIKKDNIVLVEFSGNNKLKILLKGEFSMEIVFDNYKALTNTFKLFRKSKLLILNEYNFDYIIISTYFINKDYISAISFSETKLSNNTYITAYLLLTECIDEPYPIITNFKTIKEGVEFFGLS